MSEVELLRTPDAETLLAALGPISSAAETARAVQSLRDAGHSPAAVSAIVGQALLRTRAQAKFGPFADRMLFTRAGLEQATRLPVAVRHAGRMRQAGIRTVADLGCGIGGDALAFAGAGLRVLAVEADPVTAALAAHNLAPFPDEATVSVGRAEDLDLQGVDAVWLDPARRIAGHGESARVRAEDYSPSLDWAFALASRLPTGIKLGPAHDRDSLPVDAEAQWVSADGTVVELVVWTGALARSGVRRAALVMRGQDSAELTGAADAEDAAVRPLGAYVHEPDGAVIRARLIGDLARELDAGMLDPKIAYLTSDQPVSSPFVQSFRVREILPLRAAAIKRVLRSHDIGTVEIKKRGVDIDPATFRRTLAPKGSASATLILTRIGDQRLAILADRMPSDRPA